MMSVLSIVDLVCFCQPRGQPEPPLAAWAREDAGAPANSQTLRGVFGSDNKVSKIAESGVTIALRKERV